MSCIAGKCLCHKIPTGSERLKSYKIKQKTSCKSCLDVLFVDVIYYLSVCCVCEWQFIMFVAMFIIDYFIDKSFKRDFQKICVHLHSSS